MQGGWGGSDPRIHWSSMLLRVKRVLENRAKPSRYSQARSGMYCIQEGKEGQAEEVNRSSFAPPSFCTCCFPHLEFPSSLPASLLKNLLQSQPPLILSPPSLVLGVGRRCRREENEQVSSLLHHRKQYPSSRCVPIPHQTVSFRSTGAGPASHSPMSNACTHWHTIKV